MGKPNGKTRDRAIGKVGGALWLLILVPLLAVSAYSLYYVARHLGVPRVFAVCFCACFDGVALLCAHYSLLYAQEGLSGSFPRTVVRIAALVAALVQTLHVTYGHENRLAILVWASLPISAVTVYEVHIRWERRKALAKAGQIYPAPVPSFGLLTWLMFPFKAWSAMREVVGKRKDAVLNHALGRPALNVLTTTDYEVADTPQREELPDGVVRQITSAQKRHAPTKHIRIWAREQGIEVSDRARLPGWIIEKYNAENRAAGE